VQEGQRARSAEVCVGIEEVLGFRLRRDRLAISPVIPDNDGGIHKVTVWIRVAVRPDLPLEAIAV